MRLVGYPSGQRGLTVNQLRYRFRGSNPLPTTMCPSSSVVERILGKNEVESPILSWGSSLRGEVLSGDETRHWELPHALAVIVRTEPEELLPDYVKDLLVAVD